MHARPMTHNSIPFRILIWQNRLRLHVLTAAERNNVLSVIRPNHARTKRTWSAGGVVCRINDRGMIEVVLVGRNTESLWTLPKGTPNKGEPVEYTAVREVSEETGLEVHPISHLRDTSHTFMKRRKSKKRAAKQHLKVYKTVHWYLMQAVGGDFANHDHEFDIVKWVPAEDAIKMLTFGNERRLIDDACYKLRAVLNHRETIRLNRRNTTVRSKRLTDAWDDFRWRSDPELAELDASAPISLNFDQFQRVFASALRKAKPNSLHLAIDDEYGNHIGNCMCYDINPSKRIAEFGIMIGERECWNRGYGTDATRLLLQHAFDNLPVNNLFLHTLASNHRAQSAFHNAGFKPVDVIAKNGTEFVRMEVSAADLQLATGRALSYAAST